MRTWRWMLMLTCGPGEGLDIEDGGVATQFNVVKTSAPLGRLMWEFTRINSSVRLPILLEPLLMMNSNFGRRPKPAKPVI